MSRKKKYTFYKCRDCENDFLAKPKQGKKPFCPTCGEQFYIENMMPVWIERPFQYKRHWTEEEDELIILGRQMEHTYKRISESLQGRSMKATQNRFYQLQKARSLVEQGQ